MRIYGLGPMGRVCVLPASDISVLPEHGVAEASNVYVRIRSATGYPLSLH